MVCVIEGFAMYYDTLSSVSQPLFPIIPKGLFINSLFVMLPDSPPPPHEILIPQRHCWFVGHRPLECLRLLHHPPKTKFFPLVGDLTPFRMQTLNSV